MNKQQATLKVQGLRNKEQTDEELAKKIGIAKSTFYSRLINHKWKLGEIELIKKL